MARLETEINQIFLTRSENKTTFQILYDEELTASYHIFLLAEIREIKKRSEQEELKKITDIILESFRSYKKLPAEALFESALAQTNQNLASLAQKGQKAWLGKFSALIAFKSADSVFLSNIGQISAWLKRKTDVSEILPAEKKSKHPMRTFQNFMTGKLKEEDNLILTTSNIFNYVSLPLFLKTLATRSLSETCMSFSKILQDSASAEESFASFMLRFSRETEPEAAMAPAPEFTPLPEEIAATPSSFRSRLPKFNFRLPSINLFNFSQQSRPRKFFLASFIVFVLIFSVNLVVYGMRLADKKQQDKISKQAQLLLASMNEAQSALIYKNWDEALRLLKIAELEYQNLQKIDVNRAQTFDESLNEVRSRINRISVVSQPKTFLELKYDPILLAKAGNGFLISGRDEKAITFYDNTARNIFVLNKSDGEISGLAHIPNLGHAIVSTTKIYRINEQEKLLEQLAELKDGNLTGLKFLSPNRLYTLDKNKGQVYRLVFSGSLLASPQPLLAGTLKEGSIDLGIDKDVYVLYPSELKRFVNGNLDSFKLPQLSDPITAAQKLFVASNLYVLEPQKKRLLIFNKQGQLINQITFPSSQQLKDLYVDEQNRFIYLLDTNKLLQITF